MKLILFVLILFFAGFTYLVVTLTNNEIADIRSRGDVSGSHETESGIISGNVTLVNDSAASSGKYALINIPLSPAPTFPPRTWHLLGTHPHAPSQGSTIGKVIATLQVFNGKIYMGYGDYGSNTGPIRVVYYDPATNSMMTVFTSDTEAIYTYRVLNGKLYAPAQDRRAIADYAVGTTTAWQDIGSINTAHAFDMNTLTGTDLWIAGAPASSHTDACIWRSQNDGATWSTALCIPPESSTAGDFTRFYFIGVYKGKLYIQGRDYYDGIHANSRVFDGNSWSTGPSFGSVFETSPEVFADKLVYHYRSAALGAGAFRTFNGSSASTTNLGSSIYNFFIDKQTNELYVLESDGEIRKTTNLTSWTLVSKAPTTARSIAILNSNIYIGTSDSKLYVYKQ